MSSPSTSPPSSSSSDGLSTGATSVITTLAIMGGIVLIVIAKLITKCYLTRNSLARNNNNLPPTSISTESRPLTSKQSTDTMVEVASIERFLDEIMKEKPIRFSPQHLMDFTNNNSVKLGAGGFGEVYKGKLPNGVQVAVKVLSGTLDKRVEEQFMAEVGTIGRTYHINLVRLYGFCFDSRVRALVYEYMENGSLDQYLFDRNRKIEWKKLYEIAVGAAKGIRYLHEECQKRIVHYDIKPGNILLGANFSPKVGDFGLAKLCDRDNTQMAITGGRGTPGYAAPEMWMPFPVTYKCDIYSFGMLLFEILGRRRNLEFHQPESQEWFPKWTWEKYEQGQLDSVISVCGIEEDKDKAEKMCKVALWCVQYHPEARPSMSSVVKMLEGEEEIVPPINPFLHMESRDSSTTWSKSTGDSYGKTATQDESKMDSSS